MSLLDIPWRDEGFSGVWRFLTRERPRPVSGMVTALPTVFPRSLAVFPHIVADSRLWTSYQRCDPRRRCSDG